MAKTQRSILIIDDEESIRETLYDLFTDEGFTVALASNGLEGIDVFSSSAFDILLIDMSMPEKDGLETISLIRNKSASVKIIAMSGIDWNDTLLKEAKNNGANAVIEKPIDFEEILTTLHSLIK